MYIKAEGYELESSGGTLQLRGIMRLRNPAAYEKFNGALAAALEEGDGEVTWDITGLDMINSPGINMLYQFILAARKRDDLTVNAIGIADLAWQVKILKNMKRMMPALNVELR